jgi:uncharacterized protein YrrD
MLKGKSVIGKEVLSRASGEKLPSIKDLIIAKDHSGIVALIVDEGGLFGSAKVVPIEKVTSFGKDVVVVTGNDAVVTADEHLASKESLESKNKLIGKRVFTEQGEEQARIADIFFDESSGRIVGFELTESASDDVPKEHAYLPVEDVISIGADAMVIRSGAISDMVARVSAEQGVQGAQDDSAGTPPEQRSAT